MPRVEARRDFPVDPTRLIKTVNGTERLVTDHGASHWEPTPGCPLHDPSSNHPLSYVHLGFAVDHDRVVRAGAGTVAWAPTRRDTRAGLHQQNSRVENE